MCENTELDPEAEIWLAVYCNATGHDRRTAIARLTQIGLRSWLTEDHYRGERTCGRVMASFHAGTG